MPTHDIVRSKTVRGQAKKDSAPIYVDQDDNKLKFIPAGSGTTEIELVDISSVQTLTNKTIVGGGSGSDPGSYLLGLVLGSTGAQNAAYPDGGSNTDFVDFRHTFTSLANSFTVGQWSIITFDPTVNAVGEAYAMNFEARTPATNSKNFVRMEGGDTDAYHYGTGTMGIIVGGTHTAQIGMADGTGGGQVSLAGGARGKVSNFMTNGSQVLLARGVEAQVNHSGTSSMPDNSALWAQLTATAGGTVTKGTTLRAVTPTSTNASAWTNLYAAYLEDHIVTGASSVWQIYSAGIGKSYLGGNLGVGLTTPGGTPPAGFDAGRVMEVFDTAKDAALCIRAFSTAYGLDFWADNSSGNNFIDTRSGTTTFRAATNTTPVTAFTVNADGSITSARITPRQVSATANLTAITPTSDTSDIYTEATNVVAGTFTINNPTGTPTAGQPLVIRVKSTNSQTLAWDTQYRGSSENPLPTVTTGSSLTDYYGLRWNSADSKWDLLSVNRGF